MYVFFFCRMQKDTFWIITAHSVFPYNYIKCWAEAFKLNSKNSAKPFFRCKFMSLSETNIACNIVQILYGQFLVHFSGAFAFFFKLESCFFYFARKRASRTFFKNIQDIYFWVPKKKVSIVQVCNNMRTVICELFLQLLKMED